MTLPVQPTKAIIKKHMLSFPTPPEKSVIDYQSSESIGKMRAWWQWDAFQPQAECELLVAAFQQSCCLGQ